MKKYLFIAIATIGLLAVNFGANAQRVEPTLSGTTLTNAATATVTSNIVSVFYESITFQILITKTSGTVAGSAAFQGTVDGTNWTTISTTTLTDATNSYIFKDAPAGYYKYRVLVTTTGTQVSTLSSAYYLLKGRR